MPPNATATYPGFVNWITQQQGWDVGLAPLADTAFNRCKSAIKTLDYAALGLAVVASDVAAYRGSLADGPGGMLAREPPRRLVCGAEQAGAGWGAAAGAGAGGGGGVCRARHAGAAGRGSACGVAGDCFRHSVGEGGISWTNSVASGTVPFETENRDACR